MMKIKRRTAILTTLGLSVLLLAMVLFITGGQNGLFAKGTGNTGVSDFSDKSGADNVAAGTAITDIVSQKDLPKNPDMTVLKTDSGKSGDLVCVGSMKNLISILDGMKVFQSSGTAAVDAKGLQKSTDTVTENSASGSASPTAGQNAYSADKDHSTTNTQVEGIDEADIIKNDGKFIYYLNYNALNIVRPDASGQMAIAATIKPQGTNQSFTDMYLAGKKLIISGCFNDYKDVPADKGGVTTETSAAASTGTAKSDVMIAPYGKSYTVFLIYDVSDPAAPVLERQVQIEGYAVSTRLAGNILYFITNKSIPYCVYKEADAEDLLPAYSDTITGKKTETTLIQPEDICYAPGSETPEYMLVGAFDVTKQVSVEPTAYLGTGNTVYMNGESLYVVRQQWDNTGSQSMIYRFSVNGTDIKLAASGSVPGYIINQYSMDEYKGSFRIAVTESSNEGKTVNGVYVLDSENLKTTGKITGLASGEQIYSVRFSGNTGYVVTYETMDPLFVIDLSDPTAPKVAGELKLPGFSQYLHPYGDHYLIGFGRYTTDLYIKDENGKETVVGTQDAGLKLSLFDVSDPKNPKEIAHKVFAGIWSEVSYNPKSVMVDNKKGVFAFPVYYSDKSNWWAGGLVVSADTKNGFVVKSEFKDAGGTYDGSGRFCYIAGILYFANGKGIFSYNYSNYNLIADLTLPS